MLRRNVILVGLLMISTALVFAPSAEAQDPNWGCMSIENRDGCYSPTMRCARNPSTPLWDWLVDGCAAQAVTDTGNTIDALVLISDWLRCDIIGGPVCDEI